MTNQFPSRRALIAAAPFLALAAAVKAQASDPTPSDSQGYRFGETPDAANAIAHRSHVDLMGLPDVEMHGRETIAMLAYPGMTALDLIGPQYVFASMMGATVQIVSADPGLAPILCDTNVALLPDTHLDDVPDDLDILFVPGGTSGTLAVMQDDTTLDWVRDRGRTARQVTSVCTGSLILGQAGLLDGRHRTGRRGICFRSSAQRQSMRAWWRTVHSLRVRA